MKTQNKPVTKTAHNYSIIYYALIFLQTTFYTISSMYTYIFHYSAIELWDGMRLDSS